MLTSIRRVSGVAALAVLVVAFLATGAPAPALAAPAAAPKPTPSPGSAAPSSGSSAPAPARRGAVPPAGPKVDPKLRKAPPDLDGLLRELGERSRAYETVALRFICVETVHSLDDGGEDERHDYMYVEAQEQRYMPYRQKHTQRPGIAPEVRLDLPFPDSYSWTLIFVPERQHLFRFRYTGDEWFSLRQSRVLEFTAPLPFTSGRTIYEWSGRIWVDAENFNILKVEAEPGNQVERLQAELRAYRQAPRFLVFPMGRRPRGARYDVTFLNEFHALSLPDQAHYRTYVLDLEGTEEWDGGLVLRYGGYQFFNIDAKDIILRAKGTP